jgi:hypothetical protein
VMLMCARLRAALNCFAARPAVTSRQVELMLFKRQ